MQRYIISIATDDNLMVGRLEGYAKALGMNIVDGSWTGNISDGTLCYLLIVESDRSSIARMGFIPSEFLPEVTVWEKLER